MSFFFFFFLYHRGRKPEMKDYTGINRGVPIPKTSTDHTK
jgi:hypothetical protein